MTKLQVFNNDEGEALPDRRVIGLLPGRLEQNLDDIEQALMEQRIGVFQRNGGLVMPGTVSIEVRDGAKIEAIGLIDVLTGSVIELATSSARLARWDGRSKALVPTNCPRHIADAYMSRRGRLSGIINAPTLRPDGSLLDAPGYDPATGLLYIPQPGVVFPPISKEPTREDALAALETLNELICAYDFVSPEARSVALAAMLTGVIRRILATAPGFAFTSPVPGSGKGLLCDTIAYLAHGRQPSSLTQGNEEETEKRISSALMRGDQVIAIDNITEPIAGAKLLSVLTQQIADLRWLGTNKLVGHDTRALFLFNGNNLMIPGDMCRRLLVCGIDPRCEHPEKRRFDFDPLERAQEHRGKYVAAVLTILRAYYLERQRQKLEAAFGAQAEPEPDPLGSYGEWSRWVRDALVWLGRADPVATIDISKSQDPEADRASAVFYHWSEVIGTGVRTTVKQAINAAVAGAPADDWNDLTTNREKAEKREGLLDAFSAVAAPMTRGPKHERVDPRRLGTWLAKRKNRVIGGLRMVQVPEKLHGDTQWCLERVGLGG